MKCFYHKADLDGHCSGAIVKLEHPECEMIGANYNIPLDTSTITPGEVVFVVDFSFSREEMVWLRDNTELHWIDHHKSAIEKVPKDKCIKGLRAIGSAGCELTWMYLARVPRQNTYRLDYGSIPEIRLPIAVYLLGRYDVWDHEDPRVLAFQYGMRTIADTRPGATIWEELLSREPRAALKVEELIVIGQIILDYETQQNEKYVKGMHYETTFHGYRALVVNKPYSNSKVFDSVYDPEKHDIKILFGVKPGEIKYSLFCDKPDIDVSAIAVQYGGGGHKGAAGFYTKELIL